MVKNTIICFLLMAVTVAALINFTGDDGEVNQGKEIFSLSKILDTANRNSNDSVYPPGSCCADPHAKMPNLDAMIKNAKGAAQSSEAAIAESVWQPIEQIIYRQPSDLRYVKLLDEYRNWIIQYRHIVATEGWESALDYKADSDSDLWLSANIFRCEEFGYAIKDLNNNGSPELIFFAGEEIDAIYTLKNNKPQLFAGFWDRSAGLIDREGNIHNAWWNNIEEGWTIYKIDQDDIGKELITKLVIAFDLVMDENDTAQYYMINAAGNRTMLTETEFYDIRATLAIDDARAWSSSDYTDLFESGDDGWKPAEKESYKKVAVNEYASVIEKLRLDIIRINGKDKNNIQAKYDYRNSDYVFDYEALARFHDFGYVIKDIDKNGSQELVIIYHGYIGEMYHLDQESKPVKYNVEAYGSLTQWGSMAFCSIDNVGNLHILSMKEGYHNYTEVCNTGRRLYTVGFEIFDDFGDELERPRYYKMDAKGNKTVLSKSEYDRLRQTADTPNPLHFDARRWAGEDYIDIFDGNTDEAAVTEASIAATEEAVANNTTDEAADKYVTTEYHLQGDVKIAYPQFVKQARRSALNDLIRREAIAIMNIFSYDYEDLSLEIDYEISLFNDKMLSIKYFGIGDRKGANHPNRLFYTTNINLSLMQKTGVKDFMEIENLISLIEKKNFTFDRYGGEDDDEKHTFYVNEWIDFERLKKCDNQTKEIYSYFTETSLGISFSLPYAIGNHQEIEIDYAEIQNDFSNFPLEIKR